ncbi:mitochondrial import inner membrane translocase subunit Tim13 [Drosophila santomea]|uniref:mitochondrial import inner membrane translocase subunit Tim13 n=1 Tax=Drosophila santomea TaxID=129105 RepID=UPI0019538C3D|nr:mitochondrial import inner membrane translocase subunit Tim13 [Drosophila santomea]
MAPNQHDLERIRQQIVLANIQELIQKMTHRCFDVCIAMPGLELRSTEHDCLANCMDRFMDSVQVVSCQYFRRRRRHQQIRLTRSSASIASPPASASTFIPKPPATTASEPVPSASNEEKVK